MHQALIIFIRNPVAGKVKTRLAKTLGDDKALLIYNHLLAHTHQVTRHLDCDKFLYYSDWVEQEDDWENERYKKKLQQPGNLGERMSAAFHELFEEGYQQVLIIGSDCIELYEKLISNAFEALNDNDAVIGPSSDGGYYLLGMTTYFPELFANKKWGSSSVLTDTLMDLEIANARVGKLIILNDIDEEKDLPEFLVQLVADKASG